MESLCGIHSPSDAEAETRQEKSNEKQYSCHLDHLERLQGESHRRRKQKEKTSRQQGLRCASQNLSQDQTGARDRRHQHRKQETFAAVFNHGHRRKNRGEQHNHNDGAGEKILQIVAAGSSGRRLEGGSQAGADKEPKDQRGGQDTDDAASLPQEANQLTPPERKNGQQKTAAGSRITQSIPPCNECIDTTVLLVCLEY